jgi:hypothetical protein
MKYDDQGRERARAQLARDESFHDEGWGTFHFTWREIYHEPRPAIDRLRRTFARSSPRPRSGAQENPRVRSPRPRMPGHRGPALIGQRSYARSQNPALTGTGVRRGRRGTRSGLRPGPR